MVSMSSHHSSINQSRSTLIGVIQLNLNYSNQVDHAQWEGVEIYRVTGCDCRVHNSQCIVIYQT